MKTLIALCAACVLSLAASADEPKYYLKADGTVEKRLDGHDREIADLRAEIAVLKAKCGIKAGPAPKVEADDDWWKRAIVEDSLGRPLTPTAPPKKKDTDDVCPCGDSCKCGAGSCPTKCPTASPVRATAAGYRYPDHVLQWWGVKVSGDVARPYSAVSVGRACDLDGSEWKCKVVDGSKAVVYLNGERYDPAKSFEFAGKYDDELSMWYAWTGPCKLEIKGGAFHFTSLEGDELAYLLDYSERHAKAADWRKDLVYSWFNPRLKTMTECRAAWAKWNAEHPNGWDGKPPTHTTRSAPAASPAVPVGAVRTASGRLLLPNANGTYRYADDDGGSAPPTHVCGACGVPSYLPAYPFRAAPAVQSCPNGRCPLPR